MTDYYTRQHTFVNGVTADGAEVEDEFVAIDTAFATVATDVAAATSTASAAATSAAAAAASAAEAAASTGTSTIETDTTITVGTGGTYATLAAAISYLYKERVKPGVRITLSILSNLTETVSVTFPPGVIIRVRSSGAARTITGAIQSSAYENAFVIPVGADVEFGNDAYGTTLDAETSVANRDSVLHVMGTLRIDTAGLTLKCSSSSRKTRYLLSGVCGTIYADRENEITLNNDADTGSVDLVGGSLIGVCLVANSTSQTDAANLDGVRVDTLLTADSVTHNLFGCSALFEVSGDNTFVRRAISANDGSDVVVAGSGTQIIDMGSTNKFFEVIDSDFKLRSGSFDFQSNPTGDAYIVHATRSRVHSGSVTFIGSAGDVALYGASGSTLYGSGNTYTTLTNSNLTSTWAAGGQFLDA